MTCWNRAFLRVVNIAFAVGLLIPASLRAQVIRVTLLGTGAPPPVVNRFGPSILVEAGGQLLLFDAGRGSLQRLLQIQAPVREMRALFLTHLHSDHVVGFPDLWLTSWVFARPDAPLRVWGPPGTRAMMQHLERAFEFDIKVRLSDDRPPPQGVALLVNEVVEAGVYDVNGVKVTAFTVDHAPIEPAFGYRVDFGGHSVVLSGDTRVSENLVRHAQGADVVIHEVVAPESLRRAGYASDRAQRIIAHHVTPEQAGEIFARIAPRLAVYSHIVLPSATADDLVSPTRKVYSGPLEVGEDLMVIEIGDRVTVRRPDRRAP